MSQRHHIAIVAAAATMLAAFPLTTVFASWTWMVYAAVATAAIVGSGMLVRTLRGPLVAQVAAMLGALLMFLTWIFPSGHEFLGLLPTPATFDHFGELLDQAGQQIREDAIPVQAKDGLLLLSTAGIGLVAVVVDLLAVGLRRPALAGLPMLAIYSVPVAVLPDSISFLAFTTGAIGFLWLLVTDSVDRVRRFGRRFTGEGRDVDLWEPSPLAATGRRLGLVGVVIALLVPLALPGLTSGLLTNLPRNGGNGPGPGTGESNQVNLFADLTGKLNRDRQFEMVRVVTNDPNPYYLRFGVADQVDAAGFRNRAPSTSLSLGRAFEGPQVAQVPGLQTSQYHATVEAVDFGMTLAPVYLQPTSVKGLDNAWFFDPNTDVLHSKRTSISGRRYEFDYVRPNFTPELLRTAGPLPAENGALRALTQVPPVEQVSRKVAELTAGRSTEYDQVRAIYDFFTNSGFTYNLSTDLGTSGSDIVNFLTNKKGFCVQYAAAMAWLVREAGYPARVAFGFTRGSSGTGGVSILSNTNLHAWTEVYFPTFGWVPFDATPASSIAGSVSPPWAPDPNAGGPAGGPTEDPENPRNTPGATIGPTDEPTGGAGAGGGGGGTSGLDSLRVPALLIGGALLIVLLALSPALRRRAVRRSRRSRSGPVIEMARTGEERAGPVPSSELVVDVGAMHAARADAHAAWAEVLDTLVDYDLPVDLAETPRATAQRIGGLPGLTERADAPVTLLARAEERARYALAPLRPDGLDGAVRELRTALADRATRRERLSALLLPRSVVQRWRRAWSERFHATVTGAGRLQERVLSVLSPRRLLARGGTR